MRETHRRAARLPKPTSGCFWSQDECPLPARARRPEWPFLAPALTLMPAADQACLSRAGPTVHVPHSMRPSTPLMRPLPPFPACSGLLPSITRCPGSETRPETVQKLRGLLEAALCCVSIRIPADGLAVDRAEPLAAGEAEQSQPASRQPSRPRQQECPACVRARVF